MGTCSCIQKERESDEVVKDDHRMARPLQQTTNPSFQSTSVKSEDLFTNIATPGATRPQEIRSLQIVIRGYLARKDARNRVSTWVDIGNEPEVRVEKGQETTVDPISLLSVQARDTYRRVLPFKYDQRIAGVLLYPPQILSDGCIYSGEWATHFQGLTRRGRGRLFNINGSYSEGYWRSGRLHLLGRTILSNGDYYEGGFQDGYRSGKGTHRSFDGKHTYTGGWEMDREHSYGEEVINGEISYEGEYQHGEKTGKGMFKWLDGSYYNGELVRGEIEGVGEYRWADGRRYVGSWKGGKLHGEGLFIYSPEKSYKGTYVLDKKEGFGVYRWEGKVYEGPWVDNRMHGIGYLTVRGERKRYEFANGKKLQEVPEDQ